MVSSKFVPWYSMVSWSLEVSFSFSIVSSHIFPSKPRWISIGFSSRKGVATAVNAPFSGPLGHSQIPESVTKIEAAMQEMMASMAEGWGKTWKNLEKQWISITDLNGTLPIKQARGLLIQGWHYIYGLWIPIYILWLGFYIYIHNIFMDI